MEEVKKRSLDVAVKNSRPLGSHRRKELGKVSTRGTLNTLLPTPPHTHSRGEHPCRNSDGIIWLFPDLGSRRVEPHLGGLFFILRVCVYVCVLISESIRCVNKYDKHYFNKVENLSKFLIAQVSEHLLC